jgi:hypothetical protein
MLLAAARPRTHKRAKAKDNKKENHPVCKTQLVRVAGTQIFSAQWPFFICILKKRMHTKRDGIQLFLWAHNKNFCWRTIHTERDRQPRALSARE